MHSLFERLARCASHPANIDLESLHQENLQRAEQEARAREQPGAAGTGRVQMRRGAALLALPQVSAGRRIQGVGSRV